MRVVQMASDKESKENYNGSGLGKNSAEADNYNLKTTKSYSKLANDSDNEVKQKTASSSSYGPKQKKPNASTDKLREHQQNFTKKATQAFEKVAEHLKGAKIDHKVIIDHHKKNLEALNLANKKAAEVMKSITSLQSQFVKQAFEDFNHIVRGPLKKKSGNDSSNNSDVIKESFHRAVDHAHAVGNLIAGSHKDIKAHVHGRFEEVKEEVKSHFAKHTHH